MNKWLDRYPPGPDSSRRDDDESGSGPIAPDLLRMRHEAEIDLHGLRIEEALERVDRFLDESIKNGFRKVLVIHGKGLHSEKGEAVLARAVRLHLENHPMTGRLLDPPRKYGGRGALWVLIRGKKQATARGK
jgi:DNA-nicking Smr family endonuclease